jgi:hypothetical protein
MKKKTCSKVNTSSRSVRTRNRSKLRKTKTNKKLEKQTTAV